MIGGNHTALMLISHEGVDRRELLDVLRRRWPDVVLKDLENEKPAWAMTPDEAADLGMRRRGVEPLRILVMPQKISRVTVAPMPVIAPMPVVI
jgi:hypothetical protein